MSIYEMWLSHDGGNQKLQFPVLPTLISVRQGSNNTSVDISGLGEITIMQDRPAMVVNFSSYFPATESQVVQTSSLTSPGTLLEKITDWQHSDKPAHFLVTGTNINLYCTIEDFPWEERGGDVGTIYYSLTLKEYREVSARQITVDNTGTATVPENTETRTDNRVTPDTYTVSAGDNLWNIAKQYLGDGSRYTEIFELNKDKVSNPNLIYPGQVFQLPAS